MSRGGLLAKARSTAYAIFSLYLRARAAGRQARPVSGGPPAKARPTGFTLLGLYLAIRTLDGFLHGVGVEIDYGRDHGSGGLALLVGIFAAVAAEALWNCRPWVLRATIAYFCASTLAPLAASAIDHALMPGEAVASIIAKLVIVALPLMYVHNRAAQLFPPAPAPVAALPPQP